MQKVHTKICAFILSLIIAIPCLVVSGSALLTEASPNSASAGYVNQNIYEHTYSSDQIDAYYPGLKEYLHSNIQNCVRSIDISNFGVIFNDTTWTWLYNMIYSEMYDLFHVDGLRYTYVKSGDSSYFKTIIPVYTNNYTKNLYWQHYEEIENTTNKILSGIINNNTLSDTGKALLIHDRLAANCKYATQNEYSPSIYTIYGALGKGVAVCQGYAEAYSYLLNKVGIKSFLNESDQLDHTWNVVYINGNPYHVDVTWDDPTDDLWGRVLHENFLISDTKLFETGHILNDGTVASDHYLGANYTNLDNSFWVNSTTEFQYVNDKIYYIDNVSQKILCYSDNTVLADVTDTWYCDGNGRYWVGNFSKLVSVNNNLYYTLSNAIYKYNLKTNKASIICCPDLSDYNYFNIFGLKTDGSTLYFKTSYHPNSPDEQSVFFSYDLPIETGSTLAEINGIWYYYTNGEINFTETLVEYYGNWYYVNNGMLDWNYTGLCEYNGNYYHVENGVLNWNYSGLSYYNGEWFYVTNGIYDNTYTGLTNYYDTWYYVQNGYLDWNISTLTNYYGTWYYVENGVLNWSYTGLAEHYGGWYYIENGTLNWNYTGLAEYYGGWYYIENGTLNWNYTGLAEHYGGWYYIESGMLNWNYTGLAEHYGGWYYIESGMLNWNYTGLAEHYGGWYYIENGMLNWNYTGLCEYYDKFYHIANGQLDWNYTGLSCFYGAWFYVTNGVYDNSYTGLTYFEGTWYYVYMGYLDWSAVTITNYYGTWYFVENGMVNWNYTGYIYDEYNNYYYVENGVLKF